MSAHTKKPRPLTDALHHQATACAHLGSPFMGQLLGLLAERLRPGTPLNDHLFAWKGNITASGHSVPLRIAGALHRLVLTSQDSDLAAVYPPNAPDDDALWAAVSQALDNHADTILDWIKSPPQTNEIGRAAVMIATAHWLSTRYDLPFMVSELGASAGLNLNWDQFALNAAGQHLGPQGASVTLSPDWTGECPKPANIQVTDRSGVDLMPVSIASEIDRQRLTSYIWPDQPDRLARLTSAMSLPPPTVDQGDAIGWLQSRLAAQPSGTLHLVYNTIAWQYFPPDRQQRGHELLQAMGRHATKTTPLAHLAMEADGNTPGAALTLRLWPGDHTIPLGRADFHGRWFDWQAGAAASDLL